MLTRRTVLRRALQASAAALGTSLACSSSDAPAPSKERGRRIVSTSPSMTESVFALGRGNELVGRSSFCDFPPEAASIEVIGGFADPNVEKVLALSPTLVIGERGPAGQAFVDRLASYGIESWFPKMDSLAEITQALRDLGERLDAAPRASEVVAGIEADLGAVTPRDIRPTVVLLFDWRPLVAAGPGTFPDELLRAAGAKNPVEGVGKYPKLSTEGLLALDPDVVIDGSGGMYSESIESLVASIPGLGALRAGKEGRIKRLAGSAALRPGPRVGKGVAELASLL